MLVGVGMEAEVGAAGNSTSVPLTTTTTTSRRTPLMTEDNLWCGTQAG